MLVGGVEWGLSWGHGTEGAWGNWGVDCEGCGVGENGGGGLRWDFEVFWQWSS